MLLRPRVLRNQSLGKTHNLILIYPRTEGAIHQIRLERVGSSPLTPTGVRIREETRVQVLNSTRDSVVRDEALPKLPVHGRDEKSNALHVIYQRGHRETGDLAP